jgi:uncharacterized membrane protein YagU involved in acid resistance
MTTAIKKTNKPSATKTILLSGFTAGTLDILAAFFVYSFMMKVVTPLQILQRIATGVFAKTIIGSETVMALTGLLFHYIIAFSFAIGYFFVFPHVKILHRNAVTSGLLYGVFVWAVMNLIIVPLSNASHASFALNSFLKAIIILMLCIGLPIAMITSKYYKKAGNNYK